MRAAQVLAFALVAMLMNAHDASAQMPGDAAKHVADQPRVAQPRTSQLASKYAAAQPPPQPLLKAIPECRARLDPLVDIGFERISARCPDLARQLQQSRFSAWLPTGWRDTGNNLSSGSLEELSVLVTRELAAQSYRKPPDVQHLHQVLSELGQSPQQRSSVWTRIKLWLRKIFPSHDEPEDSGWIARMTSHIGTSQTVIELITYGAFVLVIGLAGLIVASEFRAVGWSRRRRSPHGSLNTDAAADRAPLTWHDVESATLVERPRLMLELLIDRLMRAQRLPPAGSLTSRELTQAAQLSDPTDVQRLKSLALAAERVRYASEAAQPAELETAVEGGRVLFQSLETAK